MRFTALILIFYLWTLPLYGQSITTTILPDSLSPGDPLVLSIVATYQTESYKVTYPVGNDFKDPFEFISLQRFKDISNRDSIVYQLQFFGIKDTILTSKPVLFVSGIDTLKLNTTPFPVYFKSNLGENATELQPLKPIFDFARNWATLIILVILFTIIGFLIWYYRDRFFYRNPQPPKDIEPKEIPIFVNPYFIFEKSIASLNDINQYEYDQFKQWHVDLSDAIRTYYETAHSIPALESTTREFVTCLKKSTFPQEIIHHIQQIFKQSDLIKFAKVQANMHSCVLLLEQTEILKDLIRFNDETLLRRLEHEHEMRYGLHSIQQSRQSEAFKSTPTA